MGIELLVFFAALVAAGLFAGLIGGLFGVGGGIVIVPALYHGLGLAGVPEDARMHVAVATSLSTIVATSWRSLNAHRKSGAVDEALLKSWIPWIALGAVIGAALAGQISGQGLLIVFGVLALLVAANMAFGSDAWRIVGAMPTGAARVGTAGAVGLLSAMMGIGGGAFGVTIMTLCGRPIHQAVATASGFGAAIALPAALANMVTGWGAAGLPWGSLGYVNAPGFVILAMLTAITAPIGARLAHRLNRVLLKRLFAVFLALTALNLLSEAF
jgi:uncharacterized membrane protein YfcA